MYITDEILLALKVELTEIFSLQKSPFLDKH